jgi:hypothetical protein
MEPPRYVVHSGGTVGIQFIYIYIGLAQS